MKIADRDGIGMSSPIVLNDGTIKDTAGNDATVTFTLPTLSRVVANHDTIAPTITSVTVSNQHYATAANLDITVNFSEVVNVVTTENGTPPAISLDLDGTTKSAGFVSGSGSNALVFRLCCGVLGSRSLWHWDEFPPFFNTTGPSGMLRIIMLRELLSCRNSRR